MVNATSRTIIENYFGQLPADGPRTRKRRANKPTNHRCCVCISVTYSCISGGAHVRLQGSGLLFILGPYAVSTV